MIVQYTNPRFESEVPSVWNSIIARFDMVRVTDGREEPHAFLRLDAFQQCGWMDGWRLAWKFSTGDIASLRLHFVLNAELAQLLGNMAKL